MPHSSAIVFEGISWLFAGRRFRSETSRLGWYEAFVRSKDPPAFMALLRGAPVRGTPDVVVLPSVFAKVAAVAGAVIMLSGCRPRTCPGRRSTRLPSSEKSIIWTVRTRSS